MSSWVVGALIEDAETDVAGGHSGRGPLDARNPRGSCRSPRVPLGVGSRRRATVRRTCGASAASTGRAPRCSAALARVHSHPVYLQMAGGGTPPARTPSVTWSGSGRRPAATGSRRIARNAGGSAGSSSIHLHPRDTTAGTQAIGKRRRRPCGSIAPSARRPRIGVLGSSVGPPSVWSSRWRATALRVDPRRSPALAGTGPGTPTLSANAARDGRSHDGPRAPYRLRQPPPPAEGILATLFVTVRWSPGLRDSTSRPGWHVVLDENPCMVKLSNSWIIMNPGGPPIPDKPGILVGRLPARRYRLGLLELAGR